MAKTELGSHKLSEDHRSSGTTAPEQVSDIAASDAKKKRKVRPKTQPVQSLGQLLRAVYGGSFKRSALQKKEIAAMHSTSLLETSQREDLLGLALLDRSLERTRQLMLISVRLNQTVVASQIMDFVREVLHRHPAFRAESLAGVLGNIPEAASEDSAISALMSQDFTALPWPESNTPNKKSEYKKCKTNALHCLLLLFRASRGASIESIQRYLQTALWASTAQRYKTDTDKLRALISTRDPAAASISFELVEKRAIQQGQRAEAARRAEARADLRATQLEGRLSAVEQRFADAQAETERFQQALEQAIQMHETEKAHWKDDYEQLRGRVLRCLKDELSLLDEGLHALGRVPPKVHVMVDHAERAIDGLKREMDRIRGIS